MKVSRLAVLFSSFLVFSSCGESHRVYKLHCKAPPANWATEADHHIRLDRSRLHGGGVVDPVYNVINLDQAGSLNWNGNAISKKELVEILHQSDSLDSAPTIIIRIDDLTPCKSVEDFRRIMLGSATCQKPEKLCTEDEPEPPPPPEEEVETVQKTLSE